MTSVQPSEAGQSAPTNGSAVTVGQLMGVLRRVRRHAVSVWAATTAVGTIAVAALALTLALLIDHFLVLPAIMRALLLAAVIAAPLAFLWRAIGRRPTGAGSEDELALLIERRYPSLDNALINSVQLSRAQPQGAEEIVAAITEHACEAVRAIRPAAAVSKRPLGVVAGVLAFAGLLLAGHAAATGGGLTTSLHRVLAPFADNTLTRIVEVTPGETDVLAGDGVEVAVRVAGRVPTRAELIAVGDDGRRFRLDMAAVEEGRPDRLVTRIASVENDLRYYVAAGDDRSAHYELRVHNAPSVTRVTQRITPPEYLAALGAQPGEATGGTVRALAGSRVELQIESPTPFASGSVTLDDEAGTELPLNIPGSGASALGSVRLPAEAMTKGGAERYTVRLTHALGFESEPRSFDIIVEPDAPPRVSIVEPNEDRDVAIDASVPLRIEASDDHGVRKLELVQLDPEWQNLSADRRPDPTRIHAWSFEPGETKRTTQTFAVPVAELGLDEDEPVVLQAIAYDFNPEGRPARSTPRTLRLKVPEPSPEDDEALEEEYQRVSLDQLIALQRRNLGASRAVLEDVDDAEDLASLVERQERVRSDAVEIAEATTGPASNNPVIQRRLRTLADTLMPVAVRQLDRVASASNPARALEQAIGTQHDILKKLILADARQERELEAQRHRQIAEALADLIARQRALHEDTLEGAASFAALGARQRTLSRESAAVQRMMQREADRGAGGNAELAEQYAAAAAMFEDRSVRANMLVVVERLMSESREDATSMQQRVLEDLRAIEKLLRDAALRDAEDELERVAESLRDAKERLDRLVEVQRSIAEVARDLHARRDLRDDAIEETGEHARDLVEARENVADAIEQLAKDLHIHPDLPASNDLITELEEIYEDITQVPGSEDDPVSEQAAARDDSLLDNLRRMQEELTERAPEPDATLPDTPGAERQTRENIDADEIGEIPLVDLPDSLEDLVGDLLEASEDLRDEALDTASNMHFPNEEFGGDVRDGDLVSWSAQGKSGNEPPQELDQTGRSGPGRQGMSFGETVGDEITGLEGSDVQARRTPEPFQSGEIRDSSDDEFDVLATGGGKLAGASPTEGMQGEAPARDLLHLRELARRHRDYEREAETIYSAAQLLRLPTGELDEALLQMHAARRQLEAGDLVGYVQSQEQAVRSFQRTHARLRGREVVDGGDRASNIAAAILGATQEPVPEHYEEAVAEYMRRIAERR